MRMVRENLDRLADVSYVPEFHQAIIATAGQVVLSVWIKVEVTNQLAMCIINAVGLPVTH